MGTGENGLSSESTHSCCSRLPASTCSVAKRSLPSALIQSLLHPWTEIPRREGGCVRSALASRGGTFVRLIDEVLIEDPFRSNLGWFILDLRRLLLLRRFGGSSRAPLVHGHQEADHQHRPDHYQENQFSCCLSWCADSLIDGDDPELVVPFCRCPLFHHASFSAPRG